MKRNKVLVIFGQRWNDGSGLVLCDQSIGHVDTLHALRWIRGIRECCELWSFEGEPRIVPWDAGETREQVLEREKKQEGERAA